MSSSPKLSWIGLGNMGRGMVKNLAEKGTFSGPLLIYNRTFSRTEQLVAKLPSGKGQAISSIKEAVDGADIIFICVGDDKAVSDTIDTALQADYKGKLFIDCSTIHPDTSDRLAKTVKDAGATYLSVPVFGAPAMADSGQLVCVLAGESAAIEKAKPFCKGVMGRANIEYPDKPNGTATRLKIIGNTFILSMVETLSEGHTLAEKSGLGSENLHTFIETMFPGPYVAYSKRMMEGAYYKNDPLFTAPLARKDAGHARSLAESCGAKLKGLEVADEHLKQVIEHQGEKGDIASIYGAVRKESGLKYEI